LGGKCEHVDSSDSNVHSSHSIRLPTHQRGFGVRGPAPMPPYTLGTRVRSREIFVLLCQVRGDEDALAGRGLRCRASHVCCVELVAWRRIVTRTRCAAQGRRRSDSCVVATVASQVSWWLGVPRQPRCVVQEASVQRVCSIKRITPHHDNSLA